MVDTVGFIGLGIMGQHMAENLLAAGHKVSVWNRSPAKAEALVTKGAVQAQDPVDLANTCDVVITCVSDGSALEKVLFGANGIAQAKTPKTQAILDCSTIGPDMTKTLAERLTHHSGIGWIDAPISGGAPAAKAGTLIFFAGGPPELFAKCRPLFDAMGQSTTHMGPLGSGQMTKLCNQLLVGTKVVAIAEMMRLAKATGLDAASLPQVLAGGLADCKTLQLFGARMAEGTYTPKLGDLGMMGKDLTLVKSQGQASHQRTALLDLAEAIFAAAVANDDIGWDADICKIIEQDRV